MNSAETILSDDAITVRGVSKRFKRRTIRAEYTSFKTELVQWLSGKKKANPQRWIEALREIDFTIPRGRTVGILGRNGSGKSTLLKLITGIYAPTTGTVEVNGRISALLDLGAGFHPDFSGRENILINGIILGMTRAEVKARMDEIIAFSELGEFIDEPVRTYSSGMYMRLAFSVATHVDPEILIIDEILAVGDASFSKKSMAKMEEFKAAGKTILIVTHDLATVARWCDHAIWLDGGTVRGRGAPKDLVAEYQAAVREAEAQGLILTPAALSADGGALPQPSLASFEKERAVASSSAPAGHTNANDRLYLQDKCGSTPAGDERQAGSPISLSGEFELPEPLGVELERGPAPRLDCLTLSAGDAAKGATSVTCREGEPLTVRVVWSLPEPLPSASMRVEIRTALAGKLVAVASERAYGPVFRAELGQSGALQVRFSAMAVRPGSYRIEVQLRPIATVDAGPRLTAPLEILPAGHAGILLPLSSHWEVEGEGALAASDETADLIASLKTVGGG